MCIPRGSPASAEIETFPDGFSIENALEKSIATSPAVTSGLSFTNVFGNTISHCVGLIPSTTGAAVVYAVNGETMAFISVVVSSCCTICSVGGGPTLTTTIFSTFTIPTLVVTLTVNGFAPDTAPFTFEIAPVVALISKPAGALTSAYDTDVIS